MRRGFEPVRSDSGPRPLGARYPTPVRATPQGKSMALEVGKFFRDLRQAFHLSQAQAAQRIATRIDIIAALEAGQVRALPPWPETCRIVRAYTALAGLDPRPALLSLEILLASDVRAPAPRPRPRKRVLAAAAAGLREVWEGHFGQAARALFVITVPVALILLVTQTSVLEAAVAKLPPSVARIVRGAQNYVIVQLAPVRDGLRWIDVPDPRTRRSDKLQTAAQTE
jgi:transcriptional regulator with XRE-family HTH domain